MAYFVAMFHQLKQKFNDAVLTYDGTTAKVNFNYNGFKCISELGCTSAKVKFYICEGFHVTGYVPYACTRLNLDAFMKKMAELERDAKAKAVIIWRMRSATEPCFHE